MPTEEMIAYVIGMPPVRRARASHSRYFIGMSCEYPFGRERRIDIGSASLASSTMARAMESRMVSSLGTKEGAPIASWSDLAPTILALSNLVSFWGPTRITKPSSAARFPFFLSLDAEIVTTKNPELKGPFGGLDKSCAC